MVKLVLFVLVCMLALVLVLTGAIPARAQGGRLPADQQALLDRVLSGIAATEHYTSYVSTLVEKSSNTVSISAGDAALTSDKSYTIQMTTQYTTGTDGQPNISRSATADLSDLSFGAQEHISSTLKAELRVVDGVLYVQAQRESPAESTLPPLPTGWVIVKSGGEWPALEVLQLGDMLKNLGSPDLFDENTPRLLQEATRLSSGTGTLDDGTPVSQITLTLTGQDLRRGLGELMTAGASSPSTVVYYGGIDLDQSSWEMVFSLNDQDQIVQFTVQAQVVWTDFDLHVIDPATAAGTLANQTYTLAGTYAVSSIDAPLGPVPAPEVKKQ